MPFGTGSFVTGIYGEGTYITCYPQHPDNLGVTNQFNDVVKWLASSYKHFCIISYYFGLLEIDEIKIILF